MYKKKYKLVLVLLLILLILYSIFAATSTESTYIKALSKSKVHEKWKLIHVIDEKTNKKYAFHLTGEQQLRITSVHKNLFGWKVGITVGSGTSVKEIPDKGLSGHTSFETILYGIIKDREISKIRVDNTIATIVPIKEYNFRIWYVTNNIMKNNTIEAYDKNNNIIDEF